MANYTKLDKILLNKIAEKKDKSVKYIREQVSKRANRQKLAPETILLAWAHELGFSTTSALKKLEPYIQEQVRSYTKIKSDLLKISPQHLKSNNSQIDVHQQDSFLTTAHYLLKDEELKNRCLDLLKRKKYLDRVLREATVVLEDRIRILSGVTTNLMPEELVNKALNPDFTKAILVFGDNPNEQQGIHSICRGIVLAYRHKAHHRLSNDISQEEALKFCGFIDLLLFLLSKTNNRNVTA